MRKLWSSFGIALLMVMVFFPVKSSAAGKNTYQMLEESKTYYYNLDQKGKKEAIRVDVSTKKYEDDKDTWYGHKYDIKTTVTINGKKVYSRMLKGTNFPLNQVKVVVTDVDKKDKQMELMVIEGHVGTGDNRSFWSSDMKHIYYYQYKNGKAKRRQDIAPMFRGNFANIYSLHGMDNSYFTVNGKGEIYTKLCVKVQNFDYVHMKMKLKLKDGKFVKVPTKSYTLADAEFPFRPKKNITVYTKPGGTKKAFTVKKEDKIYLCSLYTKNGKKIYLKVKNKNGKTGYIEPKKVPTYDDGTNHV